MRWNNRPAKCLHKIRTKSISLPSFINFPNTRGEIAGPWISAMEYTNVPGKSGCGPSHTKQPMSPMSELAYSPRGWVLRGWWNVPSWIILFCPFVAFVSANKRNSAFQKSRGRLQICLNVDIDHPFSFLRYALVEIHSFLLPKEL